MDKEPVYTQWEQFLSPKVMQERLISASLYITAYEILKESIIDRIRSFYMVGWNIEDGEVLGSEYKLKVLSLNNSVLYASLSWLRTRGAINQIDLESFEALKKLRNSLAHNLPKLVLQGINFKIEDNFQKLFDLLRKIEVWWIVEFEIPTNPDFDGKDIDVDKITPGPIIMMQMMLEVLSGNEDLLKHYKEHNPPSVE